MAYMCFPRYHVPRCFDVYECGKGLCMEYTFEPMAQEHRREVIDIFNHYIEKSFAAYPGRPVDYAVYDHFLSLSRSYPALAVKSGDGKTVGFAFLHPYHPADSFRKTAMATYFIHPGHTGRGIGTRILNILLKKAHECGIEQVLVNVSSLNPGSIGFHLKNGFRECGRFEDIGAKAGKAFSVVWMQRRL